MDTFASKQQDYAQIDASPIRPTELPNPGPARRRAFVLLLIVFALVTLACICIGTAGIVAIGRLFVTETPRIEEVLDRFMRAGATRDVAAVQSLIAPRALQGKRLWGVEEMLGGNNCVLFLGYRELALTDLEFSYQTPDDPEYAQGLVATASATIAFEGGYSGTLAALLEEEEDGWRIWAIQVTVPPDKFVNQMAQCQPPATAANSVDTTSQPLPAMRGGAKGSREDAVVGGGPTWEQRFQARTLIDTVGCRCYTCLTCSSLASLWYLLDGYATSADEAGRSISFADRQTAGLSLVRLAFLLPSLGCRATSLLQGQVDHLFISQTCPRDSGPSTYYKRIANGGSLARCQWYLGIGSPS